MFLLWPVQREDGKSLELSSAQHFIPSAGACIWSSPANSRGRCHRPKRWVLLNFGFCPISATIARARKFWHGTASVPSQKPFPSLGNWSKVLLTRPVFKEPASHKTRPVSARMISVVIPAHNEERYLPKTLEALQRQNYGWFEVIVEPTAARTGLTKSPVAVGPPDRAILSAG